MTVSGPALDVLKSFIGGANAQYRAAGLGEYQMRVAKDGSVTIPHRPTPAFKVPAATGDAAADQAAAGASATGTAPAAGAAAPPAGASAGATPPVPADVKRTGPAPKISGLQQGGDNAFKLAWAPVAGAKQYGIWQDGVLLGHVPSPSFAGQVAANASSTIQVDAVLANGSRTALTKALKVARDSSGKLTFGAADGSTAGAPSPAATAPAAAAS
ncbi:MAG: hypothetical protein JWM86_1894 [Thermoleophilia bacterium]|nr:hypothetical protein [Thermoleophilia bacterium]